MAEERFWRIARELLGDRHLSTGLMQRLEAVDKLLRSFGKRLESPEVIASIMVDYHAEQKVAHQAPTVSDFELMANCRAALMAAQELLAFFSLHGFSNSNILPDRQRAMECAQLCLAAIGQIDARQSHAKNQG